MRYNPGGYQGVPNQREFRAAATGRSLQWERSDRPAALAAYLNVAFRSMLAPAGWGVLYPDRRGASTAGPAPTIVGRGENSGQGIVGGQPRFLCARKRRKETALAPRVPGNLVVCYTGELRFSLEFECPLENRAAGGLVE